MGFEKKKKSILQGTQRWNAANGTNGIGNKNIKLEGQLITMFLIEMKFF